jgi:hypothetical protein
MSWACESLGSTDLTAVRQGSTQSGSAGAPPGQGLSRRGLRTRRSRARGKALTGDLAGYWRYRIGDYRVLVEIRDETLVIVAITLGHRSGIY